MKEILLVFVSAMCLFGQSLIKGHVKDEFDHPLSYVNVYIEGSLEGAVTDEKGHFQLRTDKKGSVNLLFNFVGYKQRKRVLNLPKSYTLSIVMPEDVNRNAIVNVEASAYVTDAELKAVVARPLDVVTTPGAAADINRFYQTMPGVTSVDDGAGLFVRGGHVSETRMIIDGATLIHPYKFESPSGGFFGTINPFLTEGSAFYTGGLSAKYGNILSGVVDMKSFGLSEEDTYTFGVGLAAFSTQIKKTLVPNTLSVAFSGNYSDTKNLMTLNNHRTEFSKYPLSYDINLNTNYHFSETGKLKLFAFTEHNEIGISLQQPEAELYQDKSTSSLYNLKYSNVFNKLILSANIAYSDYDVTGSLGKGVLDQKDESIQIKINGEYFIGELSSLYFGAEVHDMMYTYQSNFRRDSLHFNSYTSRYTINYKNKYVSVYTEYKLPFTKLLAIKFGLRLEHETKNKNSYIDPRISFGYQLSDFITLNAAYGIYHQLPELNYYYHSSVLEMQRAEGFNLSLDYDLENVFKLRAEVYKKEYTQLLLSDKQKGLSHSGYGNSEGFDMLFKHVGQSFEYWMSYSYLNAKRHELLLGKYTSPSYDITHNYSLVYKKHLTSLFNISLRYTYRTGKPYSDSANYLNDKRLPSYTKADVNFSYTHSFFGNDMSVIYLSVSNILGKENILNRRYNRAFTEFQDQKSTFLRSVYFGISTTF